MITTYDAISHTEQKIAESNAFNAFSVTMRHKKSVLSEYWVLDSMNYVKMHFVIGGVNLQKLYNYKVATLILFTLYFR